MTSINGSPGNDTYSTGVDDTHVDDFDIGDGDGFNNDQLDVSALRTLGATPVTTNDGSGNAVLTFPEDETITLIGVTPAQMSTTAQLYAAGIPCFTKGTRILTTDGAIPVERLRCGDRVQTRDNGLQKIRWIGRRALTQPELHRHPNLRPILLKAGAFGNEVDILVSPQHGISIGAFNDEKLVRATPCLTT